MSAENQLMVEWDAKTVSIFDRSAEDPFNCEEKEETAIAIFECLYDEMGVLRIDYMNAVMNAFIGEYKKIMPVEYRDLVKYTDRTLGKFVFVQSTKGDDQ